MATLGTLTDRVELLLQIDEDTRDENGDPWPRPRIRQVLGEETTKLARFKLFAQIVWTQGVADQALYDVPDKTIEVETVLYDGMVLYQTTEESLDRKQGNWEGVYGHPPQYWLDDHADVNQIRIVPQPVDSGSGVMLFPPAPLLGRPEKNLILFVWYDPQSGTGDGQESQVQNWLEDVLVWRTVAVLTGEQGDHQDLVKAAYYQGLADLYLAQAGVLA